MPLAGETGFLPKKLSSFQPHVEKPGFWLLAAAGCWLLALASSLALR